MRAYLVDVFDPENTGVKVINDWKEIAPTLNCDCFDVTRIKLDDTFFGVYVDDEGLCKNFEDIIWGAFKVDKDEGMVTASLAGSLLIVSGTVDEDGNELDLTDEEIHLIGEHVTVLTHAQVEDLQTKIEPKISTNFLLF